VTTTAYVDTLELVNEAIRERLAERLAALLAADAQPAAIEPMPDDVDRYQLAGASALLVQYAGSQYGEPVSWDVITQDRTMQWRVILLANSTYFRGRTGAEQLLEACRLALVGWAIPGLRPFVMLEDGPDSENDGVWAYSLALSTTGPVGALAS
jgi:hypothetical protein